MKHDTVITGDLRMDYCTFGTGDKTLVILPGMALTKVTGQVEQLAREHKIFLDDFTVYIFDRKDDIGESYSIEEMAEDTARAMEALGLAKAYVLGISQGGMIAQMLAANHPEAVEKLVLASTTCALDESSRACIEGWKKYAIDRDLELLTQDMVTRLFTDAFIERTNVSTKFIASVPTSEDFERFITLANACLEFDARDVLDRISCPALVIGAGEDSVIPMEDSLELAERIGCEVYIFEGYRHAVFSENPEHKEMTFEFFTS